mgnify:CR=1 FL=1|tara:strand:+ start:89 stop:394 length:306 start_codon:yes stop_codon:yes gene_type:complete
MKRIDVKSFLIGVLLSTNVFLFMGFSESKNSNDPCDDLYYKLSSLENEITGVYGLESKVESIQSDVSLIHSDVSSISSIQDDVDYVRRKVSSFDRWGVDCN